jgi:hypothetical protein
MGASAIFPGVPLRAGMYESFYLRAVAPDEPVGAWIRHTVHKRPGRAPRGSIWCTIFDASRGRPFMHKTTSERLHAPAGGWIAVGRPDEIAPAGSEADADVSAGADLSARAPASADDGEDARADERARGGARLIPGEAHGACGPARWWLRFTSREPELRHFPRRWLYRTPLPRTKLTTPMPTASFDGTVEIAGREPLRLHGWQGMVGHNWGSEHAERWIWLHGVGFEEEPEAWLDVALGRVKLAGRMTPWVANGALALDGRRSRIGGFAARGQRVAETADGCTLELAGEGGLKIGAQVRAPAQSTAGWQYADPDGETHDVANCSIAALELTITSPGAGAPRLLRTAHGGAYELGMREHNHGVPIAPFSDG